MLVELLGSSHTGIAQLITGDVTWQLSVTNGRLLYATHSLQSIKTIEFYLQQLGYIAAIAPSKNLWTHQKQRTTLENGIVLPSWSVDFVQQLDNQGILSWSQANVLMNQISKDSVETALWATDATVTWLDPSEKVEQHRSSTWQGTSCNTLMQALLKRLRIWQTLAPDIQSPHQCPYCVDNTRLHETVAGGALPASTLELLRKLMQGASLRQLAQILKQDELKLAQLLHPYVRQGILALHQPGFPLNLLPIVPTTEHSSRPSAVTSAVTAPTTHLPSQTSNFVPSSTGSKKKQKCYKVICIDDNTSMLETMEQYLSDEWFDVTTVKNPMESVSAMFAARPNLVLMDVSMPGINGHRLCQILKRSSAFKTVPIIMVSGNAGALDKAKARAMGATDYLAKPFSKDDLLQIMDQYLHFSRE